MKKLIIVLSFVLAAIIASAVWTGCKKEEPELEDNQLESNTTATIIGVVIDFEDQQPISGAYVNITPSGKSANTDSAGYFQFTNLNAQQYTISVQKTGYTNNRKIVSTIAGETVNISISMQKSN